jgi:predicted nucleic acid-binding protein
VEGVLVDSSVILDVFLDDPRWGNWAEATFLRLSAVKALYINPIIYAEVSIGFERIEELEGKEAVSPS